MRNFILLLVLVSGLLAGYFIGDYRGRDAREALSKAIETGKTLDAERMTTISRLKTELEGIDEGHRQELAAIRKDNDAKVARWRSTKSNLADTTKHAAAALAESDDKLKSLATQRDSASGAEKIMLEKEIARLRTEQEALRHESAGNACLQARAPRSVYEALNETKVTGGQ
jgi:peptidoglycan hydrolase CwlO-like protein